MTLLENMVSYPITGTQHTLYRGTSFHNSIFFYTLLIPSSSDRPHRAPVETSTLIDSSMVNLAIIHLNLGLGV